jgi:hypothetical protein
VLHVSTHALKIVELSSRRSVILQLVSTAGVYVCERVCVCVRARALAPLPPPVWATVQDSVVVRPRWYGFSMDLYVLCIVFVWFCIVFVWWLYGVGTCCMVVVWFLYRSCMVVVWLLHGFCMVVVWFVYGVCVVFLIKLLLRIDHSLAQL